MESLWANRVRRLLARRQAQAALTRQETAILDLLRRGYNAPGIAQALGIKKKTVKNHITSIYRKLGVKNMSEVVAAARSGRPPWTRSPAC